MRYGAPNADRVFDWVEVGSMRLTLEIDRETDGRWIVEVAELAGVLVYGESCDEAIAVGKALALHVLAERIEHGDEDAAGLDFVSVLASTEA